MNISIQYQWDKETYLEAARFNFEHVMNKSLSRLILILAVIILFLDLYLIWDRGFQIFDALALLIVAVAFLLRWPFFKILLARQFDQYVEKDATLVWQIDDEYLHVKVGESSEARFVWRLINRSVKTPKGYLLYRFPMYHWIPNHGFSNNAEQKQFEAALKEKGNLR
jgi:hypothetical protein